MISPSPGPEDAARTRTRLLDAAERLFAERGYAATSVREITDAAGANLGAVNYYFRSKENLYAEVFARRIDQHRGPLIEAAREAAGCAREDPLRAFRLVGRAFLAPYEDRSSSLIILNLYAREAVESHLPPRLFADGFYLPVLDAIGRVVRHLRPDLSDRRTRGCAEAFFGQLMHIAKTLGLAAASIDERLEHAVQFTVAAVRHLDRDAEPSARAARPRRARRSA